MKSLTEKLTPVSRTSFGGWVKKITSSAAKAISPTGDLVKEKKKVESPDKAI